MESSAFEHHQNPLSSGSPILIMYRFHTMNFIRNFRGNPKKRCYDDVISAPFWLPKIFCLQIVKGREGVNWTELKKLTKS
jgi:hypothetical protein